MTEETSIGARLVVAVCAVLLASVVPVGIGAASRIGVFGTLAGHPRLNIVGAISVPAGHGTVGAVCTRGVGFADVRSGTGVTITDSTGTVIGTSELTLGTVTDEKDAGLPGWSTHCRLPFEARVPAGREFYGVEVADRGPVRFAEARLGEVAELTLG